MATKLTVGDFVLFDASDDEVEPIWLGRIMSNPEWQGHGQFENETTRNMTFGNVELGRGEVGLYVMWYEKIDVMSEKLEYWVSRSEEKPIVQNNRYLIPIEVKMHQMLGQVNVVPKLRTSTRGDVNKRAVANSQQRTRNWHAKEFDIIWKMDSELRKLAMNYNNA